MNINDLTVALRESKTGVLLTFQKIDGTVTERKVTLNDLLIAQSGYVPKTKVEGVKERAPNPNIFVFFEINSKQWKSCRKVNVVSWKDA